MNEEKGTPVGSIWTRYFDFQARCYTNQTAVRIFDSHLAHREANYRFARALVAAADAVESGTIMLSPESIAALRTKDLLKYVPPELLPTTTNTEPTATE